MATPRSSIGTAVHVTRPARPFIRPNYGPGSAPQLAAGSGLGGAQGMPAPGSGLNAAPTPSGTLPQPNTQAPPTYSGTTTTTAAPPVSTDPRDATYWANVTAHAKATADTIAGYNAQRAPIEATYGNTMAGYNRQHPLDLLAAKIAANRTGGLWSTSLDQHLGGIDLGYEQKGKDALATHDTALANLATQIAQAQQGDVEYSGQQLEDAADRAANLAANNPVIGGVAPPVTSPAAGAVGAGGTITTHIGGPFYQAYVKAYGHAPPASVSVTSPAYAAWKAGKALPKGGGR